MRESWFALESWDYLTYWPLAKCLPRKTKWNTFLRRMEDIVFKKEMLGLIRAKLLITHFIIVKVNTVCESRGTFSSLPREQGETAVLMDRSIIAYHQPTAWGRSTMKYGCCHREPEQTLSWSILNGKTMWTMASNSDRLGCIDFFNA